jgi:Uma2 family endonuclease
MTQAPMTVRRWTRAEYDRLVDRGTFEGEPLELIGGQLVVAEPQGSYHASAIGRVSDTIRAALPAGFVVRVQLPLALDDESEPEPDVAVVPGTHDDYRAAHPRRATLLLEVAESSLGLDRDTKGSLYARGAVQDYWIVNLVDRVLEVYRDPVPDSSAPYGWRYRSVERLTAPDHVALLGLPDVHIAVSDLLP